MQRRPLSEMPMVRRFLGRFREAEERDRRFISSLNIHMLNNVLWPLYITFVCLNFLDVYSTLLGMHRGAFRELNPIAAVLFGMQFRGFLIASLFKYLPAIPLFYAVFVRDGSNIHPFEVRMVKFTALVALTAANIFLFYVVAVNNIPVLLNSLFPGLLAPL